MHRSPNCNDPVSLGMALGLECPSAFRDVSQECGMLGEEHTGLKAGAYFAQHKTTS